MLLSAGMGDIWNILDHKAEDPSRGRFASRVPYLLLNIISSLGLCVMASILHGMAVESRSHHRREERTRVACTDEVPDAISTSGFGYTTVTGIRYEAGCLCNRTAFWTVFPPLTIRMMSGLCSLWVIFLEL